MPPAPTIPLSDKAHATWQSLLDTIQSAIESTTDTAALEALNALYPQVDDVLTLDTEYKLHANTALFNTLLQQINDTNAQLKKLKTQIESIATEFDDAAKVLSAVEKVLALAGAA